MPYQSVAVDFSASTTMTWLLMGYLRRRGIDVGTLLAPEGLEVAKLLTPDARMRLHDLHKFWRAAVRAAGNDETLGVRAAELIDPLATMSFQMPFALLEAINRHSANLRDAIERQRPFLRLMRDGFSLAVEDWHDGRSIVRWEFAVADEPRELIEFQLAVTVQLLRRTVGDRTVGPVEVWFAHPAPRDLAPYKALFGENVRFSADCHALIAHTDSLSTPLPSADPVLLKVNEYQGHKLLQQLPSLEDFVARVREQIEAELPHGNTTASSVADKLAISGRTLHRRLRSHGTTYQEQLDQVRFRLATRYLASKRYPLGEVASLVGFAQQSAFQRAFKTWAGQTPAEFQQRRMKPAAQTPSADSA